MNYYNKYLKYKKKYLELKSLKGGDIYYDDETLDDKDVIIITSEYNPTIDLILSDYVKINANITSSINTNFGVRKYYEIMGDVENVHWSLDTNTIYIIPAISNLYFFNRFNFILYSIKLNNDDGTTIDIKNHFYVNEIPSDPPIEFVLTGIIFDKPIDLFNGFYNNKMIDIVYDKIIDWLKTKSTHQTTFRGNIYNNIGAFYISEVNRKHKQIILNTIGCISSNEFTRSANDISRCIDNDFKVHLNIKLEHFFYVLNILLQNHENFKDILYQYKFLINFPAFRITEQYNNRTRCCMKEKDGMLLEEVGNMNFVFYPRIFNNRTIQDNVRRIINLLKLLFPDNLEIESNIYNIGSNIYPRFNFKINNSIYFAMGDGIEKIEDPHMYGPPFDYINKCNIPSNDLENTLENNIIKKTECDDINKITKTLSNHELCRFNIDNNKCELRNNINHYKLLLKKSFSKIYDARNQSKQNITVEDIYTYIGQENVYYELIQNTASIDN
jgi:hypothetical protein